MTEAPLSTAAIAVFDKVSGALLYVGPTGSQQPGAGWSALPTGYSADTHSWSTTTRLMAEDAVKVEALLLASVKAEAERRKMALLSTGGAKKTEYADKAREVAAWDSLNGNIVSTVAQLLLAFNALPAPRKASTFPYAIADAAAFGDTIADAIGRFRVGMTSSTNVQQLAAREAKGCAAIRAATTATSKRAAAAGIIWPS